MHKQEIQFIFCCEPLPIISLSDCHKVLCRDTTTAHKNTVKQGKTKSSAKRFTDVTELELVSASSFFHIYPVYLVMFVHMIKCHIRKVCPLQKKLGEGIPSV